MLIEEKYSPVTAIFCHTGFDHTIRCLKRALEILEFEASEDLYAHMHGEGDFVYPLTRPIAIIREAIWKEYEGMVKQTGEYSNDEWLKMKREHDARKGKKDEGKK